jgi:hypothetical protein
MIFLIRVAFWLSIVVLLLPTGKTENASGPQIGATEVFSVAGAAVSDARQFCSRQPDACTTGSQMATAFGHKAQASVKLVYDFLTEKFNDKGGAPANAVAAAASTEASQNTLTATDRAPAWRSPGARSDQLARSAT